MALTALVAVFSFSMIGCLAPSRLRAPTRQKNGYVIILPGIEGQGYWNASIARGLEDGGVQGSIEVYEWTTGMMVLAPYHLRAENRNRGEAREIAAKIVRYQDQNPGKPVHLIGHSGGGGIAVYVLEALPADREIASAILLAPAIAPDYDLRRAMNHARYGIYNFYSPQDIGWLRLGTTVMGTLDGEHTSAAGAVGFTTPWGLSPEDSRLYQHKLHQQVYISKMAETGHFGGHTGWAQRGFVSKWLAPLIHAQSTSRDVRYASDPAPRVQSGTRVQDASPPPRSSEAPSAGGPPSAAAAGNAPPAQKASAPPAGGSSARADRPPGKGSSTPALHPLP